MNKLREKISDSIRDIVFGLEDGVVSTLGVVIGIAEGSQNSRIVILSGIVVVLVEALSMTAGSYLSSKSQTEVLKEKIKEEKKSIEEKPKEEIEELYEMYKDRGFTKQEIEIIVKRIVQDQELWLEEMKHKELGITDKQLESSKLNALYMGLSYITGGILPVIPYFFLEIGQAVILSVVLAIISLFIIGAGKTAITKNNWWKSGLEMTLVALGAAVIGYAIGKLFLLLF